MSSQFLCRINLAAGELGQYLRQKNGAPEELMTRTGGTDGFNEEMGWLPGYEGGDVAGDGFDTAFYAEAASAREYAQRYGEDGQAQRESALKQLEGTGYEELVMQGLQAEQNSAYREKAAAFLESFMKGEYIPDVQLGELWQSAQAWKRQRTQAGNRQDTAVQTAGANTTREGLNPGSGTAYNESTPNAAEGLTMGESLTEGNGYISAGEMLGEWAEGAGGAGTKYSPVNPCDKISQEVAESFNGATFTEKVLIEDTVMYRVSGGKAGEVGSYLSKTPQRGGLQSQLDLALNPDWGNTAENVGQVVVPKGIVVYEGTAAPQNILDNAGNTIGTLSGGGNQVYVPKVEAGWFR